MEHFISAKKTEYQKKILLTLLLIVLMGEKMNAQISTDRPTQTESAATIKKEHIQLESGILISSEENNKRIQLPANVFRYGLTDEIELRLLSQLEYQKTKTTTSKGIGDLGIGAKVQIIKKDNQNTSIAFLTHLMIPTGTGELTSKKYGTINGVSVFHKCGKDIGLGYRLAYSYFGAKSGHITYSLAFGKRVNKKVGIYIEPYGKVVSIETFILNINSGLTYRVNNNLQFDLSLGTGINQKMNYVSVGCSGLMNHEKK